MKKFLLTLFLCLTVAAVLLCEVAAVPVRPLHWYCAKAKDGKQPETPADLAVALSHGGVHLDRRHGDDDSDRVVYLTFDAGYENGNVARVLDALQAAEVPAAFFLLKHFVTANSELVRRMAEEGHIIANHTASHKNLSAASREEVAAELSALSEAVSLVEGAACAGYFRPPEGSFSVELLDHAASLGYRTIFWSVAYADWDNQKQPDPEVALNTLLSRMHNGAVVLLHPTSATNAEILPRLIVTLRAKGYRFGTLDELCKER